jgi:hypothetical protein
MLLVCHEAHLLRVLISGKPGAVQIEPHGYLSAVLTAIAGGHKQTDIKELLPWNYAKPV